MTKASRAGKDVEKSSPSAAALENNDHPGAFALFYSLRIEYYEWRMDFVILLLARTLEGMFLIGLVGSLGVLLVSFVEDIETLFDMEDPGHS